MATEPRFAWIRDALTKRNFKAKDLARAWGISESSTSRFLSGEEQPDLPLSRAATLAGMLGLSIDELAKGMGFKGKVIVPPVEGAAPNLPANTLNVHLMHNGMVRVTFCQDLPSEKAGKLITLLSQ